jgi:hypothetical protein
VRIDKHIVTLTGDSDSESVGSVYGELIKIEINNHGTNTPSNNWDLEVYQGTNGGNDDEVLFKDDTVSNGDTSAIVYYPKAIECKAEDGDALTTRTNPVAYGQVTVTGANMGADKTAVVKLFFKVV